jgi:cell division protein ZapB
MMTELTTLEHKVDQVLSVCAGLTQQNGELRDRLSVLEEENQRLRSRMDEARDRLEALKSRLPEE